MSLSILFHDNTGAYLSGETALTATIDGKRYRINKSTQKVFADDKAVWAVAGNGNQCIHIINMFKSGMPVETVKDYIKHGYTPKTQEETVALIYCTNESGTVKSYYLTNDENNFDEEHVVKPCKNDVEFLPIGYHTEKCKGVFESCVNKMPNTINTYDDRIIYIYKNTYNSLNCEEIGGTMTLYKITASGSPKKIATHIMPDKNINYYNNINWIKDASIEYDKFSNVCVNSLRANLVDTNYLTANYITAGDIQSNFATINSVQSNYATIGNLDAALGRIGTLETDSLTANTLATNTALVYGGKLFVGSESDSSLIQSILINIDNRTARQLLFESTNGIMLRGHENGVIIDSGTRSDGTENPTQINMLTVTGTSQFNGEITGGATFNGDTYLNGTVKVIENGTEYNGVTQNVAIGDKTLNIKNGVIVDVS